MGRTQSLTSANTGGLAEARPREHGVWFWDAGDPLPDAMGDFLAAGLRRGEAALVVVAPERHLPLTRALQARGVDTLAAEARGQLVRLDARALVQQLSGEQPDLEPLRAGLESHFAEGARRFGKLRAFGELVDLLWAEGRRAAALAVERLWSRLGEEHGSPLLCAYRIEGFAGEADAPHFDAVCAAHSTVLAFRPDAVLPSTGSDARYVAGLQQKAKALAAAVEGQRNAEAERDASLDAERRARRELELAGERLASLQRVTSALCEAASVHDIAEVVAGPIALATGASRAELSVAAPSDGAISQQLHALMAAAARSSSNLWLADPLAVAACAPGPLGAAACLPLRGRGKLLGAVGLGYPAARRFDPADRAFAEDLARQVALALDRAQLLETARLAIIHRDDFLSVASHELRTPLTAMKLHVQGLRRVAQRVAAADELQTRIARLEVSTDKVAGLLDVLLDVSRISAGGLALERRPMALKPLLEEIADRFREQSERAGVALELQLADASGEWDRQRLDQVVTNLLSNALRYGGANPVTLSLERADAEVLVSVRDRGPGVSRADQARIFGRYERASKVGGGLGLGLWIAQEIAVAHGGALRLVSEVGQGATFTLVLPLAS